MFSSTNHFHKQRISRVYDAETSIDCLMRGRTRPSQCLLLYYITFDRRHIVLCKKKHDIHPSTVFLFPCSWFFDGFQDQCLFIYCMYSLFPFIFFKRVTYADRMKWKLVKNLWSEPIVNGHIFLRWFSRIFWLSTFLKAKDKINTKCQSTFSN